MSKKINLLLVLGGVALFWAAASSPARAQASAEDAAVSAAAEGVVATEEGVVATEEPVQDLAEEPAEDPEVAALRQRAEAGDAGARNNLGARYARGDGVAQDLAEAVRWWRLAAEEGLAQSQFNLGTMLLRGGAGLPADARAGTAWLAEAAAQGASGSALALARAYVRAETDASALSIDRARGWWAAAIDATAIEEQVVLRLALAQSWAAAGDFAEAVPWWREAADAGNQGAQVALAQAYARGHPGLAQDLSQARYWWVALARSGAAGARALIARSWVQEGDYTQAARWWLEMADDGDLAARGELVALYTEGRPGVRPDAAEARRHLAILAEAGDISAMLALADSWVRASRRGEAARWWRAAAEAGDAEAMFAIGDALTRTGEGLDRDPREAARWLAQASEQGIVPAMAALGVLALEDDVRDLQLAAKYLLRAAQAGNLAAMANLGQLYALEGETLGVPRAEAERWLTRAADGGIKAARGFLAQFHEQGGDARSAAASWEALAEDGDQNAMGKLAQLYEAGDEASGVAPDKAKALRWRLALAERGDPGSIVWTALALHRSGADDAEAFRWLSRATQIGRANVEMLAALASRLEQGRGVPRDAAAARDWRIQAAERGHAPSSLILAAHANDVKGRLRWLRLASEQGSVEAQTELGVWLANAFSRRRNPQEAAQWLEQAAKQGSVRAQLELATLYDKGEGVARDPAKAWMWLSMASEAPDPMANKADKKLDAMAWRTDQAMREEAARGMESMGMQPTRR